MALVISIASVHPDAVGPALMNNSYNKIPSYSKNSKWNKESVLECSPSFALNDWKLIGKLLNTAQSCHGFQSEAESQVWIYMLVPPNG